MLGFSLVASGALSVFGIAPAVAAPDVSAPVIVSSYVPVTTADVTSAPVKLTVKIRMTDETAVLSGFYLRMYSLESSQSLNFSYQGLVSGTVQNGVWQGTTTVPQGAAGGQWMIQAYNLSDPMNNRTTSFIDIRPITVISGVPKQT